MKNLLAVAFIIAFLVPACTLSNEVMVTPRPVITITSTAVHTPLSAISTKEPISSFSSPTSTVITITPVISDQINWESVYQEITENILAGKETPVQNFVILLTEALNSGQPQSDSLYSWLGERNFELVSRHKATNLFGDQQDVEILQIQPRSLPYVEGAVEEAGLVVALRKTLDSYYLISIQQQWFDLYRKWQDISIGDHNGNGQLEVVSITDRGTPVCESQIALYEWQGSYPEGEFVNIAQNIEAEYGNGIHVDCNGDDTWIFGQVISSPHRIWSFDQPDSDGARAVIATRIWWTWSGQNCLGYRIQERYNWIRESYRKTGTIALPYDYSQPRSCAAGYAIYAARDDVDQAISLLKMILEDWPVELEANWGVSARDYFRFKLGVWYAKKGQLNLARSVLQSVNERPTNPKFTMIPNMAETFLTYYQTEKDFYISCRKTRQFIDQQYKTIPYKPTRFSKKDIERLWGFYQPYQDYIWPYRPDPDVCELNATPLTK